MSTGEHAAPPAGHDHGLRRGRVKLSRLAVTLALTLGYMAAEVIGGLWTNSLALLADAGHMLSDAGALALAMFALWIARRPATSRRTFGFYRVEILAALANAAVLAGISVYVVVQAIGRLGSPAEVAGGGLIAIATGGLAMNVIALAVLHGVRSESLSVRGAWLHVVSDALGSVGAIVSGALVLGFDWHWADPAASIVIAALVLRSAWALLSESVAVLMEGAPGHIDVDEVRDAMAGRTGVRGVHDLHVWTITSGLESLSGHVVTDGTKSNQRLLDDLQRLLRDQFGIDHVTIQIEPPDFDEECGTC